MKVYKYRLYNLISFSRIIINVYKTKFYLGCIELEASRLEICALTLSNLYWQPPSRERTRVELTSKYSIKHVLLLDN